MNHLITGGAGFIGCNLALALLQRGETVTIFDNLSRPLTPCNLEWLYNQYPQGFRFIQADIRDFDAVRTALMGNDVVYHLAGQVAVTTSVQNPRYDFEVNAGGTLNVLEAARLAKHQPIVVFASTNKVYGGIENVTIDEQETRYCYRGLYHGITESHPLDFHSPYGCSKGAADQYVRDYSRIYGLRTVVFRQSCIYGPRQFGVEDQGWAAHFMIAALRGKPITIYGDGKQVRDMLYITDLIDAYMAALDRIDAVSGQVFNIGGGSQNSLSIWVEFEPILRVLVGQKIPVKFEKRRPGDQLVYISDISKATCELNWRPRTSVQEGIENLFQWVTENQGKFHA